MIDKHTSQVLKKLEEIGLSPKEALVYLDLVGREGVTGTSKIVKATGLHGQFVYNALDTLEERGLVTHVIVGRRKKFAATHPSRLTLLADQQKRLAQSVAADLESLTRKNRFQDFEFYLGRDAYVASEFDALDKAEDAERWDIVAGQSNKFYDFLGQAQFVEYEAARAKKRVHIRLLVSHALAPDSESEYLAQSTNRKNFEVRILPNFGESIVSTITRPHSFSLVTFTDTVLAYTIINDDVALSYRNSFAALWNLAQKV